MVEDRAKKIKLLMLDVDGVLTDGRIIYDNFGDELKCFNVHDGMGFSLLRNAGIETIIVTSKKSKIVSRRAKEMGVSRVFQSAVEKVRVYEKVLKRCRLKHEEVCYIGDDITDVPILKRVGLAVAVANGTDEVKTTAHYVTKREGGKGAAREIIDLILRSQSKWDEVTKRYLK